MIRKDANNSSTHRPLSLCFEVIRRGRAGTKMIEAGRGSAGAGLGRLRARAGGQSQSWVRLAKRQGGAACCRIWRLGHQISEGRLSGGWAKKGDHQKHPGGTFARTNHKARRETRRCCQACCDLIRRGSPLDTRLQIPQIVGASPVRRVGRESRGVAGRVRTVLSAAAASPHQNNRPTRASTKNGRVFFAESPFQRHHRSQHPPRGHRSPAGPRRRAGTVKPRTGGGFSRENRQRR